MNSEQALSLIENGTSDVLVADWNNQEALKLMAISISAILLPILFSVWTGSGLFLWIVAGLIGYGLYLGLTNEVVYYSDSKDVWNIVGMGAAPIGVLIFGVSFMPSNASTLVENTILFITFAAMAAAAAWFGIRSSNATVLLNSGIDLHKLVAVSVSKVMLVFVFAALMIGSLNQALRNKKPGDLAQGLLVFAIVGAIGQWLYPKVVNLSEVFERRGLI
jgi:hypothetical protein